MHPYHLVDPSPWPISTCISLFLITLGAAMGMHGHFYIGMAMPLGIILLIYTLYMWWRDVILEGGHHTKEVQSGLKIGMIIFILSEAAFFCVFFSSFFKALLDPVHALDAEGWPHKIMQWPGIETFDPWDLPLINTLILMLSGTTVTWAHHAILENNQKDTLTALRITIFLGICFSLLQAFEYLHSPFAFKDGIYASNFYMATGFHGVHVIIGTIFLGVCYFRAKNGAFFNGQGILGFEFAAWYWHFVDIVWILLFIFVYILGK